MTAPADVRCTIHGLRPAFGNQFVSFSVGRDLHVALEGTLGPRGMSATAADLIDVAATVYQIERQLRGRHRTNPPVRFELAMRLRNPGAWTKSATASLADMLHLLGNAVWNLDFGPGLRAAKVEFQRSKPAHINQVALLSGGVDSACGAAVLAKNSNQTRLVSFYTRQKEVQRQIAAELGFEQPAQWRMVWAKDAGRGHSFYYRSFLFLSLAAAVAESWGIKRILQFENGILATAIPPTPAIRMTKHAHPDLHRSAENLFSAVFGGSWEVKNPFLGLTKRECFEQAQRSLGPARTDSILEKTETCWFHWSNRVIGGEKTPGKPCGICIPCIIRRTALLDDAYEFDLTKDEVRNNKKQGVSFRSYCGFVARILKAGSSPSRFYEILPATGRTLVGKGATLSLAHLHKLFLNFGGEFAHTYQIPVKSLVNL